MFKTKMCALDLTATVTLRPSPRASRPKTPTTAERRAPEAVEGAPDTPSGGRKKVGFTDDEIMGALLDLLTEVIAHAAHLSPSAAQEGCAVGALSWSWSWSLLLLLRCWTTCYCADELSMRSCFSLLLPCADGVQCFSGDRRGNAEDRQRGRVARAREGSAAAGPCTATATLEIAAARSTGPKQSLPSVERDIASERVRA